MDWRQIFNILTYLDWFAAERAAHNPAIRKEIVEYLKTHVSDVSNDLATQRQTIIPTSFGQFLLTVEDLKKAEETSRKKLKDAAKGTSCQVPKEGT